MFTTVSDWFRWLVGTAPVDTRHSLAAGEPPLPGRDRHHRLLPPKWLSNIQGFLRGTTYRIKFWIRDGMPLIPKRSMDTRSPSFVLLILTVALLGMILPEILGLTNSYPQSGLPSEYQHAQYDGH